MGQNFDQAKRDDTFWPIPNILKGSVHIVEILLNFHEWTKNWIPGPAGRMGTVGFTFDKWINHISVMVQVTLTI